ncbi:MAG: PAS domain S-box protein [Vicinamibacterales bacterium]
MAERPLDSILNPPESATHGTGTVYALAAAALAAAVFVRWLLDPLLGTTLPLVTIYGAVAAAAWAGGVRPAALVAVLGYLACDYLFVEPRGRIVIDFGAIVGVAAYLFTCALIIGFGEAMRRSQRLANEQREVLRVTLRSIGDAVITTDLQGRVTYLNSVAEAITGWRQPDAFGQPLDAVFRIVNEDTRLPVENPATRALREGVVVGLANHTVLVHKDGSECPIDDSAAPIRNERDEVSGCVLTFRDVTAQRRHDHERSSQMLMSWLLASIVESSDDAIISKSLDGIIQSWNAAAERLFGYAADQAIGHHISLVIPEDRLAEEDHILANLRAGTRIDHFETERRRADGQRINVSLTISPIRDAAGHIVGASKIVRDISERKRAEADRQQFVTLIESSTDFIGICALDGTPLFLNRAGLALVGLADLEDARSKPVASFFFPEDQQMIVEEFLPSVLEKGHGEVDVRFRNFTTGEARWMAYKVLTLPDANGRPRAFATVSQDVTERRRLEDDLRRLAADLSEADRRKNEFLAMLAHELRNPIAPISNAARALSLGAGDDKDVRAASNMLERQVGQLARLVDDLLDVNRITRGRIELRQERVELGAIVQHAVEAVKASYAHMNHTLTVSLPPKPIVLVADPTRLAQIVGNMLNNACKFTDRGGTVSLTVESRDGRAVIRVRDNGIGFKAEELPRMFEMFSQVDTSLERSRDGLGIGLTLVKMMTEMHGGTVDAHSEGPGHGSEFIVRIPVTIGQEEATSGPIVDDPAQGTRRRILVVDDNHDSAESLAMLLTLFGHDVHTAHDGREAIEAAERLRPEVMLLDIGLPQLNGYEVSRHIRNQPWGKDLTLVALTGWGQEEDRNRSREAGFDAHMIKPVDQDALLFLLSSLPART